VGDVDGDGLVTRADADMVGNYLAGNIKFTVGQQLAADVTGDGKISSKDALKIAQYAEGIITTFPVCDV